MSISVTLPSMIDDICCCDVRILCYAGGVVFFVGGRLVVVCAFFMAHKAF